jgi:hypothetical protein
MNKQVELEPNHNPRDPRPCTMCDLDENDEHLEWCIYYWSSGSGMRNIENGRKSILFGRPEEVKP